MSTPRHDQLETSHDPAHLVGPAAGDAHTLIVYLHWFDEAPNANRDQFLDEATEMAGNGFASVLPQLRFPWMSPPTDLDNDAAAIEMEVSELEKITLDAAVASVTDRIVIVGHDFGAMHGMLLAKAIRPSCIVSIAPTPRWADWFLAFWPIEGDRYEYMRGLELFDPVTVAAELDMPTFFQFGRTDFYIAPMSGQQIARATPEPNRLEAYDTDHSMTDPKCRTDRVEFIHDTLDLEARPIS